MLHTRNAQVPTYLSEAKLCDKTFASRIKSGMVLGLPLAIPLLLGA